MREVSYGEARLPVEAGTFLACLASILEMPLDELPAVSDGADVATGWTTSRWLGGLGMGLVAVSDPSTFAWAGPWIARVRPAGSRERHGVVMYGVPSGVVWDPSGATDVPGWEIDDGFVVAAADIAQARPPRPSPPATVGTVQAILIAAEAGASAEAISEASALGGRGLEGDRHVTGTGTFPSDLPGSALTLIEAEVCDSFTPPLGPDEHRRNVVTRGIALNGLVGREFLIGSVRCRGMRLCEPCKVIDRYSGRAILRPLVHRGGLRADILHDGRFAVGDPVRLP